MSEKNLWEVNLGWNAPEGKSCAMTSKFKVIVGADGEPGALEAVKVAFMQARGNIRDPLGQLLVEEAGEGYTPFLVSMVAGGTALDGE